MLICKEQGGFSYLVPCFFIRAEQNDSSYWMLDKNYMLEVEANDYSLSPYCAIPERGRGSKCV